MTVYLAMYFFPFRIMMSSTAEAARPLMWKVLVLSGLMTFVLLMPLYDLCCKLLGRPKEPRTA